MSIVYDYTSNKKASRNVTLFVYHTPAQILLWYPPFCFRDLTDHRVDSSAGRGPTDDTLSHLVCDQRSPFAAKGLRFSP